MAMVGLVGLRWGSRVKVRVDAVEVPVELRMAGLW